jgi:hypothetical protein
VEACFSLWQDVFGWRLYKTPTKMLREKVLVMPLAQGNNGMLAGDCAALDTMETENNLELKNAAYERQLHSMANVHALLEILQCSQNLHAKQQESHTQHNQITTGGYISDSQEIMHAS